VVTFFSGNADTTTPANAATIESIICIKPERKVGGVYFDYHQDFCFCINIWLDVKFAIYQATHNLHAKETLLSTVSATDCTPLCFLSSNLLQYGKLSTGDLKNVGFDDIELKLGHLKYFTNNANDKNGYLGIYGSVLMPIASRPSAEFLFEPLVGRGHWGFGAGLNAAKNIYKCENTSVTLLSDFSYQYLIKRCELRSLDFNAGPLTRFTAASTLTSTSPAVPATNLTTLNLDVTPRGVINFWLASHLQYCRCHAELGYNLWWRQSEKLCFRDACPPTDFDSLGIIDDSLTFIPLTLDNLNLASASHPRVLTHKFYLGLSYDAICKDVNIGLAASYEFSHDRNAFDQWGIWANIETNF